jgi:methylase of polypeptide subunit release factors
VSGDIFALIKSGRSPAEILAIAVSPNATAFANEKMEDEKVFVTIVLTTKSKRPATSPAVIYAS